MGLLSFSDIRDSLEDVNLDHFLHKKIKQTIKILDIQLLSSPLSNSAINNITDT